MKIRWYILGFGKPHPLRCSFFSESRWIGNTNIFKFLRSGGDRCRKRTKKPIMLHIPTRSFVVDFRVFFRTQSLTRRNTFPRQKNVLVPASDRHFLRRYEIPLVFLCVQILVNNGLLLFSKNDFVASRESFQRAASAAAQAEPSNQDNGKVSP